MKALLALFVLVFSLSSLAQNHMVEFNADALMLGALTHSKTKSKGRSSDENNNGVLYFNVARTVSDHMQFAIQANYAKANYSGGSFESYGALVGGIYNLDMDFRKSLYAGVYAGMEWEQDRQLANQSDEFLVGRVALGQRVPLIFLSLENVTYSPEITFTSKTSTKGTSSQQWQQDLSIKFLQFSVFF